MTLPTPNSNFEETLSMSLQYYDASKISYIDYSVAALHIATRFTPTVRWTLRKATCCNDWRNVRLNILCKNIW